MQGPKPDRISIGYSGQVLGLRLASFGIYYWFATKNPNALNGGYPGFGFCTESILNCLLVKSFPLQWLQNCLFCKKLQNQLFSCVDVYCKIGEYFWKKDTFYIMLCYVRAHVLSLLNSLPICTCSIYRCSLPHSINLVQQTICDTIYGHNVDICVVLIETIGRNANIAFIFWQLFIF